MKGIPKLNKARTIKFVVDKIPQSISNPEIYLAGDFSNWYPDMKEYRLKRSDYAKWEITIETDLEYFQYKFTRGSWNTSECSHNGGVLPNRLFYSDLQHEVVTQIANWEDKRPTKTENVKILSNDFLMPQLNRRRRIWVYLPPSYQAKKNRAYPVIYMHDGQNLFSEDIAHCGEWGVDKTLNKLYKQTGFEAIVVGIENAALYRRIEYVPWDKDSQAKGYSQFIVNTLKPYIDSHYRTLADRSNTAIAGSSFGAVSSYFIALSNQAVFGSAILFSPVLAASEQSLDFLQEQGCDFPLRIYIMAGLKEHRYVVRDMQLLYQQLLIADFPKNKIKLIVLPDGEHREWFWRREFSQAVLWSFS